jgi:hypothetical protein
VGLVGLVVGSNVGIDGWYVGLDVGAKSL